MCTVSDTRLVHIGIECSCGREEEAPHTHAHDVESIEYLTKKAAGRDASQEEDTHGGAVQDHGTCMIKS